MHKGVQKLGLNTGQAVCETGLPITWFLSPYKGTKMHTVHKASATLLFQVRNSGDPHDWINYCTFQHCIIFEHTNII